MTLCDDCKELNLDRCECECGEPLRAIEEIIEHMCCWCSYRMHKI